jgi:hypothetical protein
MLKQVYAPQVPLKSQKRSSAAALLRRALRRPAGNSYRRMGTGGEGAPREDPPPSMGLSPTLSAVKHKFLPRDVCLRLRVTLSEPDSEHPQLTSAFGFPRDPGQALRENAENAIQFNREQWSGRSARRKAGHS